MAGPRRAPAALVGARGAGGGAAQPAGFAAAQVIRVIHPAQPLPVPIITVNPTVARRIFAVAGRARGGRRSIRLLMKHVGLTLATLGVLTVVPAGSVAADERRLQDLLNGGASRSVHANMTSRALPGDHPWAATAARLRAALMANEPSAASALLSSTATVQVTDGRATTVDALARLAATAEWSCALAYPGTPDQLASDLAATVVSADVDPALRAYLTPPNESAMRTADVTAVRWLAHVLKPRPSDPTGVVLLYHPAPSGGKSGSKGKLSVVLLCGEQVGTSLFRVSRMVVGQFDVTDGRP